MQLRNITSVLVVVLVTALYGCDSDDNALTDTSASMPAPECVYNASVARGYRD